MKQQIIAKLAPTQLAQMVSMLLLSLFPNLSFIAYHTWFGDTSPKCKWGDKRDVPRAEGMSLPSLYLRAEFSIKSERLSAAPSSPGDHSFEMVSSHLTVGSKSSDAKSTPRFLHLHRLCVRGALSGNGALLLANNPFYNKA